MTWERAYGYLHFFLCNSLPSGWIWAQTESPSIAWCMHLRLSLVGAQNCGTSS